MNTFRMLCSTLTGVGITPLFILGLVLIILPITFWKACIEVDEKEEHKLLSILFLSLYLTVLLLSICIGLRILCSLL